MVKCGKKTFPGVRRALEHINGKHQPGYVVTGGRRRLESGFAK